MCIPPHPSHVSTHRWSKLARILDATQYNIKCNDMCIFPDFCEEWSVNDQICATMKQIKRGKQNQERSFVYSLKNNSNTIRICSAIYQVRILVQNQRLDIRFKTLLDILRRIVTRGRQVASRLNLSKARITGTNFSWEMIAKVAEWPDFSKNKRVM